MIAASVRSWVALRKVIFLGLFPFALLLICQNGWAQQILKQVSGRYQTNVWVYTPPGYSEATPGGYPVILSLHGGSGIVDNDDYNTIVAAGPDQAHLTPARLIYQNKWNASLPFIVVSPHLKRDPSIPNVNEQTWPTDLLDEVVEYVKAAYNVDETRLYVTGISVGATGTWDYAIAHADKVAAIIPMGGKGAKSDACNVKDVPIWAFHGQDDPLVPSRFSTDMVQAILDCSSQGKYKPQLNLNNSMGHEIWNPLFTGTGGYNIYDWLLSFTKGSDANKNPFVFAGNDRRVKLRTGPIYLYGEYFDNDGTISNVQWTQVGGSPALTLEDTQTNFLRIVNPQAGTFKFRLTVTDDDGASRFDEVQLIILSSADSREISAMTLYEQNRSNQTPTPDGATLISDLSDGYQLDMNTLTARAGFSMVRINIKTTATTGSNRIKWSINGDQHTRDNSVPLYVKAPTTSAVSTGWGLFKGTYLVCATPYSNANFDGEGTSLCYKIIITDEAGIQKFYGSSSADLSSLTSWHSNPNGTGSTPPSFTADNQWFIVQASATLSTGTLTISGNKSRLVVASTGTLNVSNSLSAPIYVEGNGAVNVTGSGSVSGFNTLSRTSRVTYNVGAMTINTGQLAYGHLTIQGNGIKKLQTGSVNVKGDLTIGAGAEVQNTSLNGNSTFFVSGNVTISNSTSMPYTLRFVEGYGNQYLTLPGDYTFREFSVEGGTTVSVIAPGASTITIGSGSGGGLMDIHAYSLLKLNGHNLTFINNAALNRARRTGTPPDPFVYTLRTGKIELTNSILKINAPTNTDTAFNLYPAGGKNLLKLLDVTLPSNHPGIKIMDTLKITDGVNVTGGKIFSRGNLTLLSKATSNSSSTAYVGPLLSPATINGIVNVERIVKKGKLYRYLSFPVKDFSVDELQTFIPVTGSFAGSSPGYSTSPSLFVFNDPSNSWVAYPASSQTNAAPLEIGKGYAVYVRESANATKLVMKGELHIGDLNYSSFLTNNPLEIDSLGWNLIGNPYAAPIKWGATAGWDTTKIDAGIYVRDNNNTAFRFYDGSTGNLSSGIIPVGQSFYVRAMNASPQLVIHESAKVPVVSPEIYRAERTDDSVLEIDLKRDDLEDNTYIRFHEAGSQMWQRGKDTVKKKNGFFNISILSSDDHSLAIKNLSDTLCTQECRLLIQPKGTGNYTLTFQGTAFDNPIYALYLNDRFKDAVIQIKENDNYVFEVNSEVGSYAEDRFSITIEQENAEQPVINLQDGYLVSSTSENIQWMFNGVNIDGETQQVLFPVQEGNYTVRTVGKVCSKMSNPYNFRVTGIEDVISRVKVFPNPASTYLNISGLKPSQSNTAYQILSLNGATIQNDRLEVDSEGRSEIKLKSLSPGLYILKIATDGINEFKLSIK
jgi:predicted esterase